MTISKMTQRSNRLDARIDRLIEAQERFVAALTEALARFSHPMVDGASLTPADLTLRPGGITWTDRDRLRYSTQPEDTERRVPRRAPSFGLPDDIDPRALETIEIELPDGVALQSAAHPGSEPMSDEDLIDQGYDPNAFSDMAAELAGDIEEDEPLPPQDDEGVWRKRLSLNALRLWQPDWGPRPGQSGCLVPSHLLNGRG